MSEIQPNVRTDTMVTTLVQVGIIFRSYKLRDRGKYEVELGKVGEIEAETK